jgi:hypothetical protein
MRDLKCEMMMKNKAMLRNEINWCRILSHSEGRTHIEVVRD